MPGDQVLARPEMVATVQRRKQYAVGLALLLVVVIEWTGSNFLTQDLFDDGYHKPFFVTYMNTASFAVYLVPAFLKRFVRRQPAEKREDEPRSRSLAHEDELPLLDQSLVSPDTAMSRLTTSETAKLASIFCLFWFLANWTVNASLDFTSVASTTILSSMSGFFTLLIGRLFHVELLSPEKVGVVIVSFAGGVLVSLADTTKNTTQPLLEAPLARPHDRAFLGDFLALGSALFYALYVVLLKIRIGDESRIDMQLFFGFVGIFSILGCWPIGAILHWTGAEMFELPSSNRARYAIMLNMFITLSSDFLYVLAMLKTTPLVVTIGLSLTIPFAVAGDLFLGHATSTQSLVGAALVLIAFITIGLEDRDASPGRLSLNPEESSPRRSTDQPSGLSELLSQSQTDDDEDLRRSVEAMLHRDRCRRGSRAMEHSSVSGEGPLLDRGRSRTRSGTFRRERVSGSLRRSEERRTRSRAGRKGGPDRNERSEWDYGPSTVPESGGYGDV